MTGLWHYIIGCHNQCYIKTFSSSDKEI